MKHPMLELRNVSSGYLEKNIVSNISFSLNAGERLWIKGGNGSGKSTLLKTIARIITNNTGYISINGNSINSKKAYELPNISYFMQGGLVLDTLTIMEHLVLATKKKDVSEKNRLLRECFLNFPIMQQKQKELAGNLSGGVKQILSCAILFCQDSKIWLLDEPLAGLDEKGRNILLKYFKSQTSKTMIIVEHAEFDLKIDKELKL